MFRALSRTETTVRLLPEREKCEDCVIKRDVFVRYKQAQYFSHRLNHRSGLWTFAGSKLLWPSSPWSALLLCFLISNSGRRESYVRRQLLSEDMIRSSAEVKYNPAVTLRNETPITEDIVGAVEFWSAVLKSNAAQAETGAVKRPEYRHPVDGITTPAVPIKRILFSDTKTTSCLTEWGLPWSGLPRDFSAVYGRDQDEPGNSMPAG